MKGILIMNAKLEIPIETNNEKKEKKQIYKRLHAL